MDSLFLFALLVLLTLVIGAFLGCAAFFRLTTLKQKIEELESQIYTLQQILGNRKLTGDWEQITPKTEKLPKQPQRQPAKDRPPESQDHRARDSKKTEKVISSNPVPSRFSASMLFHVIRNNWMSWLGGICVGLAGIFMVRYSIEKGLLGPGQRIAAATATGIGLHLAAEYLHRRTKTAHPAFAALAGGASITLYASMLAALHLYQLLNPGLVFCILTAVSLLTMLLALRYGPVLAILGILGAYVVPALVSTDSGTILMALIYSVIITTAALFLLKFVHRVWLWIGILAGSLGWWAMSLTTFQADGLRGIYLAVLVYLFLAIPSSDWLMTRQEDRTQRAVRDQSATLGWRFQPIQLSVLSVLLAHCFSIGWESFSSLAFLSWSPLIIIIVWVSGSRPSLAYLPWISLILQWFIWLYCGLDLSSHPVRIRSLSLEDQNIFLIFALGMTAVYSLIPWYHSRRLPFCHIRSSIIYLSPVLWLALSYLLITDLSIHWEWAAGSLALALSFHTISNIRLIRDREDRDSAWLILASHFAFSLAAAMCLRQAGLTLVLATQVVSVSLMINRYKLDALNWLVKLILGLVVIRLSLNPWLLQYPADIHWSLWTYGGSAMCCALAAWIVDPGSALKKWLEAAFLQVFVLFLAAETRYLLYDGSIFLDRYTLKEATINTLLWSALGLVYYYRSLLNTTLTKYYNVCSRILMLMATLNYGVILCVLNPLWSGEIVGATPIWNILLPAYGAPVAISLVCRTYYDSRFTKPASLFAGTSLFVFVCLEIRHLWQAALDISLPTSDGELYTYSIVWLIMAISALLAAAKWKMVLMKKAGMGLLLAVVAKIFLIDMSDLEGLLRVASFMGLGLSLLGLAYLYQKISNGPHE